MFKSIGLFFGSIGKGFGNIWNQLINKNLVPLIDTAAHAIAGAVVGFVWPSIQTAFSNYFATPGASLSFVLTPAGWVPLLVGAVIGGIVAAGKHSPNQAIANLAANVTPEQSGQFAKVIDDKVYAAIPLPKPATPSVLKTALFLMGFLVLASSASAGLLGYVGVPLNPGQGNTEEDLLLGPVEIAGVNINNGSQVDLGLGFGLVDSNVTGLSASTSSITGNWALGILGKAYLQNTNPDYVAGTFGIFGAFNLVKIVFNNSDFPLISLSAERLPDGSIQGFFNLVDLLGIGSNSSYRKINR